MEKTTCSAATLQSYIILRATATGPEGCIWWVLLIFLLYLQRQRDARGDNGKNVVCFPHAAWKGMDKSVRNKSLLFFLLVFAMTKS